MDESLPQHEHYEDDGCDLFPSCLRCPLPQCRYDKPGRRAGKELRNREMVRLHAEGMGVKELAHGFGVSVRTVQRTIAGTTRHHEKAGVRHE